jgi:hypothetical protein
MVGLHPGSLARGSKWSGFRPACCFRIPFSWGCHQVILSEGLTQARVTGAGYGLANPVVAFQWILMGPSLVST